MSEERISLLNSIVFDWVSVRSWDEMYQRLVAYKNEHKDTKVPSKYDQDPQLGNWVSNQRSAYNRKQLSRERTRLLNSIGFDWVASQKQCTQKRVT